MCLRVLTTGEILSIYEMVVLSEEEVEEEEEEEEEEEKFSPIKGTKINKWNGGREGGKEGRRDRAKTA